MSPMTALERRIDRHQDELLGFLRRRAPDAAEELAQEVWLRVARAAPDCDDDARFRAYAFTVARRLLVDHHRRRAARITLVGLEGGLDQVPGPGDPEGSLRAADLLATVDEALSALKPEIAEVFRLRMTEDVSFQQIAARQATGLNTALGRMHRATKAIARALAERGLLPRSLEES